MKQKTIYILTYILFLSIIVSCSGQKNIISFSNAILENNMGITKEYLNLESKSNSYRKKVLKSQEVSIINYSGFTYIIEGFSIESGITYTTIWSKTGEVNYKYDMNSYEIVTESNYSPKLKILIEKWDESTIKMKERNKLLDGLDIIASRIKYDQNSSSFNVENISFKEWLTISD